ncbi:hypothetical protein DM01DRAFT_1335909 [Hesseltinella vesiculosa]|uniref:Uncharacterized protein n=1 Tax=Hesseltinella vesiculosa TaxID=101127 RepID=A0A1X2GHX8_9FUNG|nr:hypothetical protein DM01DRAFT_1335909 [Hesseltinella vesiculosa]
MEVFQCLCHLKDAVAKEDFAVMLQLLCSPRYAAPLSQVAQQLKPILRQPACAPLEPEIDSLLQRAEADPDYDAKLSRVADTFNLLYRVYHQLPRAEFAGFVDCFMFDNASASHETIMQRLDHFKRQLTPAQQATLESIMNEQAQSGDEQGLEMLGMDDDLDEDDFSDGMETADEPPRLRLAVNPAAIVDPYRPKPTPSAAVFSPDMQAWITEAHRVMNNDDTLCQPFTQILESDQLNGLPFTDSLIHIFQWVQTTNPSLWDALSPILEQMHGLQDTNTEQFSSYEEFVQRTFLDTDGQTYLDGEIAQAQMHNMLNNMSM